MKEFDVYYIRKSEDELKTMLEEAVVVLDTSSLLNLYSIPHKVAKRLVRKFSGRREKFWLPYHVVAEYHAGLDRVQESRHDSLPQAKAGISSLWSDLERQKSKFFNAEKKHPNYKGKEFVDKFQRLLTEQIGIIKRLLQKEDLSEIDELSELIRSKLFSNVGQALSVSSLKDIERDGEKRYNLRFPPGYKDIDKSDSVIFYEQRLDWAVLKKYGDLIIWREILSNNSGKSVLFVTDDRKEDWYHLGTPDFGPRKELIQEALDGGVEDLWFIPLTKLVRLTLGIKQEISPAIDSISKSLFKTGARRKIRILELLSRMSESIASNDRLSVSHILSDVDRESPFLGLPLAPVKEWLGTPGDNPFAAAQVANQVEELIRTEFERFQKDISDDYGPP